jgi:DNA-binding response OmpR family regulator
MTLVLLVDDDLLVADIVRASLEPRGYVVGVVNDGVGVLNIVEFKRPSLVILDCMMPIKPGMEVLREMRTSRRCYDTPVLMLTARASARDESIAIGAGATEYLRKPVDPDKLVATVEALIGPASYDDSKARSRARS